MLEIRRIRPVGGVRNRTGAVRRRLETGPAVRPGTRGPPQPSSRSDRLFLPVDVRYPAMPQTLSQLEVLALLALVRLADDGYGVTGRREIAGVPGRDVSMAAAYAALDRLERAGLVKRWQSDPRPERGGRARRHFALTAAGRSALAAERALVTRMWQGVRLPDEGRRR